MAMRKYTSYILSALAAVFMAGCMDIDVNPVEDQGPSMVRLQLTNADLVATRAVTDDNLYNEDLIESVQCFFAKTGSDDILHSTGLIEVNQNQTGTLSFPLPSEVSTTLFDGTANCDVYVLANYGTALNESSINTIKGKAIALGTGATQDSFVMDGKTALALSGTSVSGTVTLIRAAAKIVVRVSVDKSIEDGGITWTPEIDAITMTYDGSVNGSKISALPADADASTEVRYAQSAPVFTADAVNTTDEMYVGYQTVPFYSFPVAAAQNEGEIAMIIPWSPDGGEAVNFKYQIPVDIEFLRNSVHVINVHVAVLGNVDGTKLEASYKVVEWTDNEITAALSKPKYLVVEENNIVMNNINSYTVGYSSSDNVTAVITSITKPNYSAKTATITNIYNNATGSASVTPGTSVSGNKNPFTLTVDRVNHTIQLSHTLINDNTSKSFDLVPYDITIKVTNESGLVETITVKQYPAVYVVNHLNNGASDVMTTTWFGRPTTDRGYDNQGYGYVMVNRLYDDRDQTSDWMTVEGFDENSNNPNMYIVTTTALDAASAQNYILGDSRSATEQTASQVGFTGISDVNGKTLKKYRATKTDNEDYLSPQFRISSAYGQLGSNQLTAAQARYRCASYQEDGYPAGRWRLATTAELKYIAMLCANGALPISLFGGSYYWSATNNYRINTSGGTVTAANSTTAYLRCVYDDWYWGSEQLNDKTEFTWGDESTTAQLNQ